MPLTLGVISPSDALNEERLVRVQRNCELLSEFGFRFVFGASFDQPGSPWVPASSRARDIHQLAEMSNVDMLIGTWGGTGANQLASHLEWHALQAAGKPFIGDSDIGVLANTLAIVGGVVCFLGRGLGTLDEIRDLEATWVHPILASRGHRVLLRGSSSLRFGCAEGVLVGGDLRSIVFGDVANLLERSRGAVLVVESPAPSNEVTQMLVHLFNRSAVRRALRGLILGRVELEAEHLAVVAQSLSDDVPVALDGEFGHGRGPCVTLPIGARVELRIGSDAWTLSEVD